MSNIGLLFDSIMKTMPPLRAFGDNREPPLQPELWDAEQLVPTWNPMRLPPPAVFGSEQIG